jgi:hypothetical protein
MDHSPSVEIHVHANALSDGQRKVAWMRIIQQH